MCYNTIMHGNPTPTVCDGLATAYRDNKCIGVAAGLLRHGPPDTARPDKGQAPSVGKGLDGVKVGGQQCSHTDSNLESSV